MSAPTTPSARKHGRLIAFEGVDGAGKSTVISEVRRAIVDRGERVFLPRIGKEHSSRPTRMIRRLTRDSRNLELSATSELLLYAAREAQVLSELVRPALERRETVLLDRSLLTPLVLGAYGRGLSREQCEHAVAVASGGLEPDVTFVFDVHPRTSRIRKRLEKARQRTREPGGRKGLAGSAFKERIRDGYAAIAEERGYPVFHVERIDPAELSRRVLAVLLDGANSSDLETPSDAEPCWMVPDDLSLLEALDVVPPTVGLYLSRRLIAAREYRKRLLDREPRLVAWALDLEDPLRTTVAESDPDYAVRGWARKPLEGPEDLRIQLMDRAPDACLLALKTEMSDAADAIRERHIERAPGAVIRSIEGREDSRAEALRDACWRDAEPADQGASLIGCAGEVAWKRRDKLLEKSPVDALRSLKGISGDRADAILTEFSRLAPKAVLSSLEGRADPAALALRKALFDTGREVIDSIRGLDDDAAWALRERAVERWPSTVAHSLLGLLPSSRVSTVRRRCEEAGRGDLHLLRRTAALDEYDDRPDWAKGSAEDDDD